MGAPRAGKIREGMVFIVETFSDTDSVSQVAQIKGQFFSAHSFDGRLLTCLYLAKVFEFSTIFLIIVFEAK